jgi:cytochrome c-type biogenesis protein CcmE
VIALSVAAALAIFVVYTALAGNGVVQLTPSTIGTAKGTVLLIGKVVGPVLSTADGRRFTVRDMNDNKPGRVTIDYTGSVPSLFKTGSAIAITGVMRNGRFVGARDSLTTKCPDHYAPSTSPKA